MRNTVQFSPNSLGEEGVDHINISSQSKTYLGLVLDPSYRKVFDYPHIGKFSSVLNLWYWLQTEPLDDRLRKMNGIFLRDQKNRNSQKVENFAAIIAHATQLKLAFQDHALLALKELPPHVVFVSYYTFKGTQLRICSSYSNLITSVAQVLRQAAREDCEPDMRTLLSEPGPSEQYHLEPFLRKRLGKTFQEKTSV